MIPELQQLASPCGLLRIPPETDVPVSPRVFRILDTAPLRRLARVSQLGLVSLVYPGAVHSRLEHSMGVYRAVLLFLQRLCTDRRFGPLVDARGADLLVLSALLHDVGHWPFCHPIEDMRLEDVPGHEDRAARLIGGDEVAAAIHEDWACSPQQVIDLISGRPAGETERLLASLLSGPIDADKLDYLVRDSLHAGVPYGRNFDAGRLVASLCVHPHEPRLAITDKGRTAAEMMVFARYVMFSEVYWHHAVRAATAMLQRAIYLLRDRLDLAAMYELDEPLWIARLRRMAEGTLAEPLAEGLFGPRRRLFKRIAQFNVLDDAQLHGRLAHRPYAWLVACSEQLARRLGAQTGMPLGAADVVIDAPPVKLEVDINVDVVGSDETVRPLAEVSPVAAVLARQQFDQHVKRVRVFVREEVRAALPSGKLDPRLLEAAIEAVDPSSFGLSSGAGAT